MTDFQTATLAAQHAALWIAAVAAVASLISAAASTAAAIGIWYGIRAMVRANKARAVILDRQHQADERRHEEAMAALADQRRDDERRHEEAMQALADRRHDDERRHEEAMTAHGEAMAALADQRQADERRHEEAMQALADQRVTPSNARPPAWRPSSNGPARPHDRWPVAGFQWPVASGQHWLPITGYRPLKTPATENKAAMALTQTRQRG